MGAFFSAAAFAWLSHMLGWMLLPNSVARGAGARALVLWIIAAAALFFFRDPMTTLLVVGCAILLLAPLSLTHRVAFFLIAAPCLPVYLSAPVPFPGLDNLIFLTHYKIAILIVLLPLFLYSTSEHSNVKAACPIFSGVGPCPICSPSSRTSAPTQPTPPRSLSVAGTCLLLYVGYTAIIVTGASNPTGGLRFLVDQLIWLAIPFFAIRIAIRTLDDVDTCLTAFLIASVFLAAVTFVSSAKQWDFYALLQPISVLTAADMRAGFVRINATATTHSLAFHCAAGLVALQYLKAGLGIGWLRLNAVRVVLLTGIYFTDSRGALSGLVVAAIVYAVTTVANRKWLLVLGALVALGGVAGSIWLVTAEFSTDGRMGSFTYRQDLLRTAIPYIFAHPLFGDYYFYENGAFAHLRQGQGIIDITNLYLQVALHYGLIGLILFFMVVLVPLSALIGRALQAAEHAPGRGVKKARKSAGSPEWRQAAGAIAGILSGWLFLVATTSDVGLTVHIGLIFAAMAQRISELSKARMVGPRVRAGLTARYTPPGLSGRPSGAMANISDQRSTSHGIQRAAVTATTAS